MSVGAEPARCAFEGCQAGGVILPGAQMMSELVGIFDSPITRVEGINDFHPGCWAAELHRTGASA